MHVNDSLVAVYETVVTNICIDLGAERLSFYRLQSNKQFLVLFLKSVRVVLQII